MKTLRPSLFALLFFFIWQQICWASSDTTARLALLEEKIQRMQQHYEQQIASLTARINELSELSELSELPAKLSKLSELSAKHTDRTDTLADNELASLRSDAAGVLAAPPGDKPVGGDSDVRFIAGELGRQAENPELSVVSDFLYSLQSIDGIRNNADATLRNLGVHYETYLDPFTLFKGTVPVKEDRSNLGEAYITRYGLSKNLNMTLGRFRQQFGVVHRWHQASLEQAEFPLAMRRLFGDGGLVHNGISFDWQIGGSGNTSNELTMQLTEAENARLFAGNTRGVPALLLHFKSFRDLNVDTWQEIGLTALAGINDRWSVQDGAAVRSVDQSRAVVGFGIDFTRLWEPADNMKYRNFMWRSELYGLKKAILTPDDGREDSIFAWGAYTNFHWKLDRQLESGLRIDYYRPDSLKYASLPGLSLAPLAVVAQDPCEWQLCPYLTWQQSPWVKYRLELNYKSGRNMGPDEKRLMLQCVWSAGPHKHDRY